MNMKAIIGILMMVLMTTIAIAEEEFVMKIASECKDDDGTSCNKLVGMLGSREKTKQYYSAEQYDPSKEYTLLNFPTNWNRTKIWQEKLTEYFGVNITREEMQEVGGLRSEMSWGSYYVKVNGPNVTYDFNMRSVFLGEESKIERFPELVEKFRVIWLKIYERQKASENITGNSTYIDNSGNKSTPEIENVSSEEKLGKEISEAATTTKKPNSIIQGIIGYFKALFRVGE